MTQSSLNLENVIEIWLSRSRFTGLKTKHFYVDQPRMVMLPTNSGLFTSYSAGSVIKCKCSPYEAYGIVYDKSVYMDDKWLNIHDPQLFKKMREHLKKVHKLPKSKEDR